MPGEKSILEKPSLVALLVIPKDFEYWRDAAT
jgi:hypothetical protein